MCSRSSPNRFLASIGIVDHYQSGSRSTTVISNGDRLFVLLVCCFVGLLVVVCTCVHVVVTVIAVCWTVDYSCGR